MSLTVEINPIPKSGECDVEWKIPFASFLEIEDFCFFYSHCFIFEGQSWKLVIYLNDIISVNSEGYVHLCLWKNSLNNTMSMEATFSFKNLNGKKEFKRQITGVFKGISLRDIEMFVSRSEFDKRQGEFVSPSGFLTVVCTQKRQDSCGGTSSIAKKECSHCKEAFDEEEISSHAKKCRIKCPDYLDIILLRNWQKHECRISNAEDDVPLCEDLKKMLLNGLHYDLILKVGDIELRAHKDILRARSKVFESMLSLDTQEKNNGVIDIPDCDAQAMEQFLCYIYTGKVDTLEESNVLNLYYIADKYDMKGLKRNCRSFIKESLSISNVCDVIQLALNHTDSVLLDLTTEYFMDNVLEIMNTVEWQNFGKANFTVANELMIKSIKKLKNVKI